MYRPLSSDTLTIDHLVIGEFVTGPPSSRLVIGELAYSSWIFHEH